jgi:hypothetical protein
MYQMEAEAARINMVELEDQGQNLEDLERPTASRAPLNNLDHLVNWSHDFLNRQQGDQVYPAPAGRDEQVALRDVAVDSGADREANGFLVCKAADSTPFRSRNFISIWEKGIERTKERHDKRVQGTRMCEHVACWPPPLT